MGYLYALIAAVLFGANGSVTKVIVESGISPAQLTLFRTLGTALVAGAILVITDRSAFRISARTLGVMAILGVMGVAALQFFYAVALSLMPVGITLLLEYTAVLAVAVIAFVFFKEKVRARLWVAIGCVLAGLALVAEIWSSSLSGPGVIAALLAATALTVYFLVGERQVTATSPMAVAFWSTLFAGLFWAFFSAWWTLEPSTLTEAAALGGTLDAVTVPVWAVLLWNVLLGTFAPFYLSFMAMRRLSATVVGIVASSEVVFGFGFAWLWRGEMLAPVQILGAGVVLLGIVLAQTARAGKAVDLDLAVIDDARRTVPAPDVGGSA